jgi:hypothetical protein
MPVFLKERRDRKIETLRYAQDDKPEKNFFKLYYLKVSSSGRHNVPSGRTPNGIKNLAGTEWHQSATQAGNFREMSAKNLLVLFFYYKYQ